MDNIHQVAEVYHALVHTGDHVLDVQDNMVLVPLVDVVVGNAGRNLVLLDIQGGGYNIHWAVGGVEMAFGPDDGFATDNEGRIRGYLLAVDLVHSLAAAHDLSEGARMAVHGGRMRTTQMAVLHNSDRIPVCIVLDVVVEDTRGPNVEDVRGHRRHHLPPT